MKSKTHTIKLISLVVLFFTVSLLIVSDASFGTIKPLNLPNIQRISRSIFLIQHEYYDPQRVKPLEMFQEGLYEIAKEIPEFLPEFSGNHLTIRLGAKTLDITLEPFGGLFDVLYPTSQIFDFLHENYHGDVAFDDLEYSFIAGMLYTLDPHSNILTPKIYKEFKTQTEGEYGGLGIVISIKDNELTVVSPMDNSPADKNGIKAEDKILQIDDQITTNMNLDEAADLMRGPPGTKVVLKIKSKNIDPRDVTLVREVINIESVQTKLLTLNNLNFAVVQLKGFQENTFQETVTGLRQIQQKTNNNLQGVVLDLRNNAGGLLDQAILIADLFLKEGDIVYTVGADNTDEEVAQAQSQMSDVNLPMVVLINEGSASAAEIVAGALKNNNRAIVMGQKSFGKGSVQSLFSLRDGSSLKLTIAQYLTPGRESIQAVGITPDIHLYPSIIGEDFFDLFEDSGYNENKLDAHLSNVNLVKTSQPIYNMTFLQPEDPETKESLYTSKIKDTDFAFQLALKILSLAKDSSKTNLLSQILPLLNEETKKQAVVIAETLKTKKIDWSDGQTTAQPKLDLRFEISDETSKKISAIRAGTEITITVTVKNSSSQPAHQVITDIEALNPLLNHKEFVFGKVAPQEELSRFIKVKIPDEVVSYSENIKFLTYTEKTQTAPLTTHATTQFVEKQQPQFAYSYEVFDGQIPETMGNKNHIPEKGESVVLRVHLKNISQTDAVETTVNLKNKEGKFALIQEARKKLGLLKAQSETSCDLKFSIKNDFAKDKFQLQLFGQDDKSRAGLSDTLTFSQIAPQKATPEPNHYYGAPTIIIKPETKQSKNKLFLSAQVAHDQPIKDISVFATGKKVLYLNAEKGTQIRKKDITKNIALEDGLNSITIRARGETGLMSEKSITLVYDKNQ